MKFRIRETVAIQLAFVGALIVTTIACSGGQSQETYAGDLEGVPLTPKLISLVERSSYIVFVTVDEAVPASDPFPPCSPIYGGSVTSIVHGNYSEKLRFRVPISLKLGGEYLVFLSESKQSDIQGSGSRFSSCKGREANREWPSVIEVGRYVYAAFEVMELDSADIVYGERKVGSSKFLVGDLGLQAIFTETMGILGAQVPMEDGQTFGVQPWLDWRLVRNSSKSFVGEQALAIEQHGFVEIVQAAIK